MDDALGGIARLEAGLDVLEDGPSGANMLATLCRDAPVAGKQIHDANIEVDMDPNLAGFLLLAALMVVLVAWLRADLSQRMDRLDTYARRTSGPRRDDTGRARGMPPGMGATLSEHGECLTRIDTVQAEQGERLTRIETAQAEQGECLTRVETAQAEQGERLTRIETAQAEQDECLTRIEETLSEHDTTDRESEVDRERLLREGAPRGKYAPLYRHLIAYCDDEWFASFDEVEEILGFRLPDSAYLYPAWWSNGGHSQAVAWRVAGWRTHSIDLGEKTLMFERMEPAELDPDSEVLRWE